MTCSDHDDSRLTISVEFLVSLCVLGRKKRYAWWKLAVKRSMNWELTPSMEHGMHGSGPGQDAHC